MEFLTSGDSLSVSPVVKTDHGIYVWLADAPAPEFADVWKKAAICAAGVADIFTILICLMWRIDFASLLAACAVATILACAVALSLSGIASANRQQQGIFVIAPNKCGVCILAKRLAPWDEMRYLRNLVSETDGMLVTAHDMRGISWMRCRDVDKLVVNRQNFSITLFSRFKSLQIALPEDEFDSIAEYIGYAVSSQSSDAVFVD